MKPHKVLLVDTSTPGSRGSMARYADLVARALGLEQTGAGAVEVSRLSLAAPRLFNGRSPTGLATWLNHFWLQLVGRAQIRQAKAQLVHILDGSYAYLVPVGGTVHVVATVHDLIPALQHRGHVGPNRGSWMSRRLVAKSIGGLHRCVHLFAVSSNTANDLAQAAGIDPARLTVAPPAVSTELIHGARSRSVRDGQAAASSQPCLLHVGNNAFYKNREGVVRIFSLVRKQREARLVLAGPAPARSLLELVATLGLESDVRFVVDADDTTLLELYGNAAVFLFPSLYEGFGWPPLEAMACGCPVVCSTAGSLPEVVGDAALTAVAEDEAGLAKHCLSILEAPALASTLREKGRRRVESFTLERMRRDLLTVYDKALGGSTLNGTQPMHHE